jgi:tripartite-type tricarboxylate transporter receptor subunit TctC
MKNLFSKFISCVGIFVVGAATVTMTAFAPPAKAVDFSGKTIQAFVAFSAGGGGTYYTRLYLPFFKKYLPGNPTIIVRNMPGGGGLIGSNWFQANAKPDGLFYSVISTSNMSSMVMGDEKVKYNLLEWESIIMEPLGTIFYTTPKTGVTGKNISKDVATLLNTQIVTGAKTLTSSELHLFLAFDMLGINKITPVFGIGSGAQRKAVLRGEFNMKRDSAINYLKKVASYAKKGKVVPWMTLGYEQDGKIVRDPYFPNLPTIIDAYKAMNGGKAPSGVGFDSFKHFFHMAVTASKGFALPPKTPKAIVDVYVAAAKKIEKDKGFAKRAGKLYGVYPKAYGKDANDVMRAAVDVPPQNKKYIRDFVKRKFNMTM